MRFANDSWCHKKFNEIADFQGGGTPSTKEQKYWEGDIPWISSADIFEDNVLSFNKTRYITIDAINNSATKLCPPGTILIVSRVGVGKLAISDSSVCTSQDFTNVIKYSLNKYFLVYYLQNKLKHKSSESQGTSIKGITMTEIKDMDIFFPTKFEQVKIGKFLSLIDKRIETQNKIISALESQKKAICNQIRTIESNTIDASIIFEFMDKTNHQSSDGNDSGNYIFFTNEETTNKFLDIFDFDGEYIIANTGGKANFKYFNGKFATMSDCLVIKTKFAKFYYYYLQSIKNYVDYVGFEGSGLKHLNKKWLLKLQIPSFNEKHKHIVETLDLLDCKLSKEKLILQKYKEQKKFLLSNMFI